MKLQFLGANRQVTGSCYLLEAAGLKVLIDCGLFQEREYVDRNWHFPIDPSQIDVMLLTHAHLDHCGRLPRLVRDQFHARVLTTAASADLARIVLEDAAEIQEEDAQTKRARHEREQRRGPHPVEPLYTVEDAQKALKLFEPIAYNQRVALNNDVHVTFRDAGHILGSAMLEIAVREDGRESTIVFSGDIGRWDKPLIENPSLPTRADYVIMESTYGNRERLGSVEEIEQSLADAINETVERGGNIVIPTFAIDRAQELMFHIGQLVRTKKISRMRTFLDSPMAVDVTELFQRYPKLLDMQARQLLWEGKDPLQFAGLQLARSRAQSKEINDLRGSNIIMAGAGMCTGGRIKHHLVQNLPRPESTILFVGYQSRGTLGREIVDGAKQVRIFGRQWDVRAKVVQVHGLSAHADRSELLRWAGGLQQPPRQLFVTHGEEEAAFALAQTLREQGWSVDVPEYKQQVELSLEARV